MRKIRAISLQSNQIGNLRNTTYRNLISRMNKSLENGYYLEAIALQESIIADRLESQLNFIRRTNQYSFKTLETLIEAIRSERDCSDALRNLVLIRVNSWKQKRNESLHELAKINSSDIKNWEEKLELIKNAALEGKVLYRDVLNATKF